MSEYSTERMLQVAEDLSQINESGAKRMAIDLAPYEQEVSLKEFLEKLKQYRVNHVAHKVMIGFLGEMSSGKSTLINMMIACPLLPMATVVTSSCPVEICYGKTFCLQVFTYPESGEEGEKKEKVVYTYEAEKPLSTEQLQALKAFASHCLKANALLPENLNYFFDTDQMRMSDGAFEVDEGDPRQVGQLLLLALNGYVGQDTALLTKQNEALIQERNDLMAAIFHLTPDSAYGVRIRLNCELLRNGVTLVDLPGLGSDVVPHAGITTGYLRQADCCVLVFGADGKTGAQNKALNVMAEFEMMKSAGRDSRFLAVINKCDRLLGQQNFSSQLAQVVNRIKPQITAVKIDQIIPVSAYYADVRMVEQGLPPERTIRWPQAQMFGMSIADYQEKLNRDYHTEFRYTDPLTGQEISSSTAQFIENTIGAYSARIRFLNAIREGKRLADECGVSLGQMEVQVGMIRLLQEFGDTLMRDLLSKMESALKKAQTKFTNELDRASETIQKQQAQLGEDFQKVRDCYATGLKKAEQTMNSHLETSINQMTSNFLGRYLLTVQENQSIYDHLIRYFKTFDFGPYIQPGTNILQNALYMQRVSYKQSIIIFQNCFRALQADCDQGLSEAYQEFEQHSELRQAPPNVRKLYTECYENAKKAILSQVEQIANQMIAEIERDERVEQEISRTLNQMQDEFTAFTDFYHGNCVLYLEGQKKTTIFRERSYLDVKSIRRELNKPFVSEMDRRSFPDKLSDLLLGQDGGHAVRIQNAVKEVNDDFSNRVVTKYNHFFPIIAASVKNLFGLARPQLMAEYLRLGIIAQSMEKTMEYLRDTDEVRQAAALAADPAHAWAKESCDEMLKALSGLLDRLAEFSASMQRETQRVQRHTEAGETG